MKRATGGRDGEEKRNSVFLWIILVKELRRVREASEWGRVSIRRFLWEREGKVERMIWRRSSSGRSGNRVNSWRDSDGVESGEDLRERVLVMVLGLRGKRRGAVRKGRALIRSAVKRLLLGMAVGKGLKGVIVGSE